MDLICGINEILDNAKIFDSYLETNDGDKKEFAINCLKNGRCFVVIKYDGTYRFYPSKYIGYKQNNISKYYDELDTAEPLSSENKKYSDAAFYTFDGRMSNKAINKVLGCVCVSDDAMSDKYVEYCEKFGIKGSYKKKFWLNIIEQ